MLESHRASRLRVRLLVASVWAVVWTAGPATSAWAQAPTGQEEAPASGEADAASQSGFADRIDVIGVAPLDDLRESVDRIPWTVHRVSSDAFDQPARAVGALLESELPGINLAPAQGSALQSDVLYRGYGASPLLGANQGLSVYEDGVRINEVFGDVVAWDLAPTFAAERVELTPGANPMFGLNTLGGAVALATKSGFDAERLGLHAEAGSFGRRSAEFAAGGVFGALEELGWFASARSYDEEGWRDHSPSSLRQGLGKFSQRGEQGQLSFTLGVADNELIGNGVSPVELLELDRRAVFTHPDRTRNDLFFPRVRIGRRLTSRLDLEAQAYLRDSDVGTYNADGFEGGEEDDDEDEGPVNGLDLEDYDAVNNQSRTGQQGRGASVQLQGMTETGRWLTGLAWDGGRADFSFASELATLTPSRTTVGSGLDLPGAEVRLRATTDHFGFWGMRHWTTSGDGRVTFLLQARYNDSRVELNDRLGVALDGDHSFSRLAPSAGVVWEAKTAARSALHLFANVSQSVRVPTPVELTCADPEDPCRLPNAFVADPPLDQVVTTSAELGLRAHRGSVRMSAAVFSGESADDIIFISSGAGTSAGYFTNVEATRRQGLELGARGRAGRLNWDAAYTLVEATFEDRLILSSPAHPLAIRGEIEVEPGDLVPGVPRRQFRAGADLALGERALLGARLVGDSVRYLRGDEANLLAPVGSAWRGDLWARIGLRRNLDLDLEISNVTDREYATFGALGEPDEVLGDAFEDPRFLAPAAPRAMRVALRLRL